VSFAQKGQLMIAMPSDVEKAATVLVEDHMFVKPGENVIVTADTHSDAVCANAVFNAAHRAGVRPALMLFPQLPFQGALADPYVPEALGTALGNCDVWIDLCFPYLAGSRTHDVAMKANRLRYLLGGDIDAEALVRLYGTVNLDALFTVQAGFDRLMAEAVGQPCRIQNEQGMDVAFVIAKPGYQKLRRADRPGLNVLPGSGMIYPEPESVRGTVVIEAVFHEYFVSPMSRMTVLVDGRIREIRGGGAEQRVMHRALLRAGGGQYGYVIHFSYGFHPAARPENLMESIRVPGNNAVGFGLPWWVPGGGENHPDGIASMQSIWIGDAQIVRDSELIHPAALASAAAALEPEFN
jgi:hypothetical protein